MKEQNFKFCPGNGLPPEEIIYAKNFIRKYLNFIQYNFN